MDAGVTSGIRRASPALATVLALAACGGRPGPPAAGHSVGSVPDLRGAAVMVFPAQAVRGVSGAVDAELAFALRERGGNVTWLLPERMQELLARSPGVPTRLDALPVGAFLQAEVRRVGDPLYGDLRRMAAVTGADLALLPIDVRYREGTPDGDGAVEITAALVDARDGRVYWFGVVDGDPGTAGEPRTLASAAGALARILRWR